MYACVYVILCKMQGLICLCVAKLQRKKTLLKDYERSGKSSVFVDKRIGEENEDLGEFDKAILRTQRELRVIVFLRVKYHFCFYRFPVYND